MNVATLALDMEEFPLILNFSVPCFKSFVNGPSVNPPGRTIVQFKLLEIIRFSFVL